MSAAALAPVSEAALVAAEACERAAARVAAAAEQVGLNGRIAQERWQGPAADEFRRRLAAFDALCADRQRCLLWYAADLRDAATRAR